MRIFQEKIDQLQNSIQKHINSVLHGSLGDVLTPTRILKGQDTTQPSDGFSSKSYSGGRVPRGHSTAAATTQDPLSAVPATNPADSSRDHLGGVQASEMNPRRRVEPKPHPFSALEHSRHSFEPIHPPPRQPAAVESQTHSGQPHAGQPHAGHPHSAPEDGRRTPRVPLPRSLKTPRTILSRPLDVNNGDAVTTRAKRVLPATPTSTTPPTRPRCHSARVHHLAPFSTKLLSYN